MSERSTIFCRSLIREEVKILPAEIGRNIRDVIVAKLKGKLEGVCTRHGYVRPGSIRINDMSPGRIEGSSLNGDIIFKVSCVADVCNPATGHVVPARIVNSNKFGLLAHSGIEVNGKYMTILETVITRHNYHGGPTDVPLDSVRVGDDVFIEVLGRTFELNDSKISAVGRLLRAIGSTGGRRTLLSTAVINAADMNTSDTENDELEGTVTGEESVIEGDDEEGDGEGDDDDALRSKAKGEYTDEGDEDEEDDADLAEEDEEDEVEEEDDAGEDEEEEEDMDGDDDFDGLTADDDDFSEAAAPVVRKKRS